MRPIDSDLIFYGEPGRDGKRRPYQFNPVWLSIKRELKLTNVHFHDLRHEAVSRFVEAGFSDQEVSAISGHKSMQMLKRYTHLRAEDLVSRMDALDTRSTTTWRSTSGYQHRAGSERATLPHRPIGRVDKQSPAPVRCLEEDCRA